MAFAARPDLVRVVRALVTATHAAPTATVTAVMTAFAVSVGRGFGGSVLVLVTVLTGQLSVGWSNDYLDRFRDAEVGRHDKPIPSGDVSASTVRLAAAIALVACVVLSLANGWRAGLVHLAGVAAAWAYNLGVKATWWSPLPYAIGFGALPAFVVLGLPAHPTPPLWLVAGGSLLGLGAHFANVLPDLEDDRATGVVGAPHHLGRTGAASASAGLLLAATGCLALGPSGGSRLLTIGGLVMAVVLVAGGAIAVLRQGAKGSATMFRVSMVLAVLDVALLLGRGGGVG